MELHEAEKELCHLGFREEVLKKEKELLAQFADHVSKVHSMKVSSQRVYRIVLNFLRVFNYTNFANFQLFAK